MGIGLQVVLALVALVIVVGLMWLMFRKRNEK